MSIVTNRLFSNKQGTTIERELNFKISVTFSYHFIQF